MYLKSHFHNVLKIGHNQVPNTLETNNIHMKTHTVQVQNTELAPAIKSKTIFYNNKSSGILFI